MILVESSTSVFENGEGEIINNVLNTFTGNRRLVRSTKTLQPKVIAIYYCKPYTCTCTYISVTVESLFMVQSITYYIQSLYSACSLQ